MEAPELPRTVFADEAVDHSVSTRMLVNERRAVVDDIVDYNPDATVSLRLGKTPLSDDLRRNER